MIFTYHIIFHLNVGGDSMYFYIASGFMNKSLVQSLISQINKELSWSITYDWTQNNHAQTIEELQHIGIKEYEGVIKADVVIIVLPGGKGCHTELGIALGANKKIVLYDPQEKLKNLEDATTFYYLPQITQWNGDVFELERIMSTS
jgi:hypothetical protein